MKSTEFRIGNLVDYFMVVEIVAIEEKKIKVKREIEKGYYNIELCPIDSLDLKPISLTEDWLLKMGAEVFEFDNGQPNQYRYKDRLIVIRDGKFVEYGTSVILDCVHQLQNLFFALKNEELSFDTPKTNSQTQAQEH
jgi:hypothetical protein